MNIHGSSKTCAGTSFKQASLRVAASVPLVALVAFGLAPARASAQVADLSPQSAEVATSAALILPAAPATSVRVFTVDAVRVPMSYRQSFAVQRTPKHDKLAYYAGSTVSARNFAEALLVAGTPTLPSAPIQPQAPAVVTIDSATVYGNQMDDYGHRMDDWRRTSDESLRFHAYRLEAGFATVETRQLLSNLVLPLALRQEGRYRPAAIDAGFGERMANAAESIVVTHSDSGRLVPNYSKLAGTVAAAYIGKSVYAKALNAPELNSQHFVANYIAFSLAGDLATNVAHEVLRAAIEPDVREYTLYGGATEDSYYPLSIGGKVVAWGRSTYAPRNFVQGALTAAMPSIKDQPVQPPPGVITTDAQALAYDQLFVAYGTAIQDWRRQMENDVRYHGYRFIGGFSASETQMVLQNLIVPIAFSMEPRYIPLGSGYGAGARLGHAFRGLVVTRTDSGAKTINLPVLLGTAGGALLAQQVYYPALGAPSLTTNSMLGRTISLNLAADVLLNIKSEFFHHPAY